MKFSKDFLPVVFILLIFFGCKENEEPQKEITVRNLLVETILSTDGSGLVTFRATAENAIKFIFYFGEGLDEPLTLTNGNTTHTYLSSGTYTVRVQAFSEDNRSVEKSQNILFK